MIKSAADSGNMDMSDRRQPAPGGTWRPARGGAWWRKSASGGTWRRQAVRGSRRLAVRPGWAVCRCPR